MLRSINTLLTALLALSVAAPACVAQAPDPGMQFMEQMARMMPVEPWGFYPDDQVLSDFSGTVFITLTAAGAVDLPTDNDDGRSKCSADLSASLTYTTRNGNEQTSVRVGGEIIETYYRPARGEDKPGSYYSPPRRERTTIRYSGPADTTPIRVANLHHSPSEGLSSFQMQIGTAVDGRSQISHIDYDFERKINDDPPDRGEMDGMALFFSPPPFGASNSRWAQLMRTGQASAVPWAGPFYYESSSANGETSGTATVPVYFHRNQWATAEQWEMMGEDPTAAPQIADNAFFPGTMTVRWCFVTRAVPGEMTIGPEKPSLYEQWIPVPMPDEDDGDGITIAPLVEQPDVAPLVRPDDAEAIPTTFGPALPVYVTARIKPTESSATAPKGRIHFYLCDVTRKAGLCNDYPPHGDTEVDLYFVDMPGVIVDPSNPQHAYTEQYADELTVGVAARDTGAWGVVQAFCDDLGLIATDERTGRQGIVLPLDDNQNFVSDAWEREMGLRDGLPHDDDDGDGVSYYYEYRGFMTGEGFVRTDPRVRDR